MCFWLAPLLAVGFCLGGCATPLQPPGRPGLLAHIATYGSSGNRPPKLVEVAYWEDGVVINEHYESNAASLDVSRLSKGSLAALQADLQRLSIVTLDEQVHAVPCGAFSEIGIRSGSGYKLYRWSDREADVISAGGATPPQRAFLDGWEQAIRVLRTQRPTASLGLVTAWNIARERAP